MPLDCPERLKDGRTCGLRLVDLFGPKELQPDFTLGRRTTTRCLLS
jgi:hypothetical protein